VGRKAFAACECRRQNCCTGDDRLLRRHDRAAWLIAGKFPILAMEFTVSSGLKTSNAFCSQAGWVGETASDGHS